MITIHKWTVALADETTFDAHRVVKWLDVQMQHGSPVVWAVVDTDQFDGPRTVFLRGTGHPFNGLEGDYIGTFQMDGGDLILHLFDELRG